MLTLASFEHFKVKSTTKAAWEWKNESRVEAVVAVTFGFWQVAAKTKKEAYKVANSC